MKTNNCEKVKTMSIILIVCAALVATLFIDAAPAKCRHSELISKFQSPQWSEGKFRNELNTYSESILKILGAQMKNKAKHQIPSSAVPVINPNSEIFTHLPPSGLRVTWLGHSSVLVEIDGYRVLTDPVWSDRASPISFAGPKRFFGPPLPLNKLPEIDAVVISHDHFDHLDEQTIKALKDRVPLFAVPLGVGEHLVKWGVDPYKIAEHDWWDSTTVGTLKLTATPARHFSGRSLTEINNNPTLWSGWSIAGPDHRIYYSGDTAMFPGFKEIGNRLGPFDLTLIEAGAYNAMWPDVHIGPEQAVEAHRMLRGKLMMPVHWGTFDLALHNWTEPAERIIAAANRKNVSVVIPKPGESFEPKSPPQLTRWWPKVPWQTAEKSPIVSTGLSNEIAYIDHTLIVENSK